MHLRAFIATSLVSIVTSLPAWGNYSCVGTIDSVGVSPGTGWVILSSTSAGFASVYLCLLEGTTTSNNGNVTPGQCKAMLTTLQMAVATQQGIELDFSDSLTCTTHPAWAQLTGWYYGPVLYAPQ
jgi:hypothetical protein